jgi:Zn-dependent protease
VEKVALGVFWYAVFVFSVTVHEAAHAWAALHGGDPTAYRGGQVSLDPIAHIRRSPFGMVILPILSLVLAGWPFGFASAPFDPIWASRHPRRSGAMALAGPLANLLLFLAAAVAIRIGVGAGFFEAPEVVGTTRMTAAAGTSASAHGLATLASMLLSLNLILLLLNLLPLPPLDGWGALPLVLSRAQSARLQAIQRHPGIGWLGILVAWQIFPYVFQPLMGLVLALLYPGVRYG